MNRRLFENIIFYFSGFFIISIFLIFSLFISSSDIEYKNSAEFSSGVKNGISKLEELGERINLINSVIENDTAFNSFLFAGSTNKSFVADQKTLRNLYRNICYVSGDFCYIFTIFLNTSSYISSGDTSSDFDNYFDKFLTVSAGGKRMNDAAEFTAFLLENYQSGNTFLSLDSLSYISLDGERSLESPFIFLMTAPASPFNPQFLTCFIIPKEIILSILFINTDLHEAKAEIKTLSDERPLLSDIPQSYNANKYYCYEEKSLKLNSRIKAIILKDSFRYGRMSVFYTLLLIIVCGIISGLFFAVYYGFQQYQKTRNLIEFLDKIEVDFAKQKDVADIQKRILKLRDEGNSYKEAANELERLNMTIQFQNIITQGIKTNEDSLFLDKMITFASNGYKVVVMKVLSGNSAGLSLELHERISSSSFNGTISVHSGSDEEIFLVTYRGNEDLVTFLEHFLTSSTNAVIHFGISPASNDVADINSLYNKAESAVISLFAYNNENRILEYDEQNNNALQEIITIDNLSKLRNLLLRSQEKEVKATLEEYYIQMLAFPLEAEERKEEFYYNFLGLYQDVINILGIKGIELSRFDPALSIFDLKELLINWTEKLCSTTRDLKKSHNDTLLESIISVIENEYSDTSLSAYETSMKVNVSEKYLQSFFKEQMGTSFSQYLLVHRLKKAKDLLENSELSNEQIATLVGFGAVNTFYRNFNKFYGVTPKIYKSGLNENRINS